MKRIVVLISGNGRNLQALLDGCVAGRIPAKVAAVISNRSDAYGLQRAAAAGVPGIVIPHCDYVDRAAFDAALVREIDRHAPDIVAMAGFMRVVGVSFVQRYRGRLLNIHPSLLPQHPGLRTHERVLEAGDPRHGATVHYVTEELDGGPRIIQGEFSVKPHDTAQVLAERVMHNIELKIYPQAVAWLARDELSLRDHEVWFRGKPLTAPLRLQDLEPEFR